MEFCSVCDILYVRSKFLSVLMTLSVRGCHFHPRYPAVGISTSDKDGENDFNIILTFRYNISFVSSLSKRFTIRFTSSVKQAEAKLRRSYPLLSMWTLK